MHGPCPFIGLTVYRRRPPRPPLDSARLSAKPINPPWAPPVYRVIGAGHPCALSVYNGLFGGNPETQFSDILPPTVKWDQSRAKQRKENQESRHTFAFPPRAAAQHEKHQCLSAQSFPGMPMPQAIGKRLVQNQARYLLRRKQKSSKWYGYADSRLGFFLSRCQGTFKQILDATSPSVALAHLQSMRGWRGTGFRANTLLRCLYALDTERHIYIYISPQQ